MTANQLTAHPPSMDDGAKTIGTAASNIHEANKPIDPPNLSGNTGKHTGLTVNFVPATRLVTAFQARQRLITEYTGRYGDAVDVMGKALTKVATDYDQTNQADQVGANHVNQALASVKRPGS